MMMRKLSLLLAMTMLGAGAAQANAASPANPAGGEIGYPRESLGYDALVAGRFHQAEVQIETSRGVAVDDPARLLNLGAVHMQTGRLRAACSRRCAIIAAR
jgi:hypothetical protein